MRKLSLVLGLAVLCLTLGASAQSRRVPPSSGTLKSNERPAPQPKSTPPVSDVHEDDAPLDDGDAIRVETSLVSIPVRVLDRKGRFIGGLTKENFSVFEDNTPQEIAYFTNEAQPFTVALVLDMSYSTTFKIGEIQSAAIAFIDLLRPDDRVMVIAFDQEVRMLCEATNDRARIYRAIRSTQIGTGTSLYEAVDLTMNHRMRSIKGRKAIVLFTDGVDTTSRTSHDLENLRDAMELDALIYPIRYDTFADVQAMKNRSPVIVPGRRTTTPPTVPAGGSPFPSTIPTIASPGDKGTTAKEYADAEEYLNQLALRTGGTIYQANTFGNLNAAFSKIASELREFYSLGYYPPEDGRPGKSRKIKVRVDQQNLVVRARDSYIAAKTPARKATK